jgi:hypothetical protein
LGWRCKKTSHKSPDERHPCHAAHKDDFVEIGGGQFRIGQRAQTMPARALDDRTGNLFERRTSQLVVQIFSFNKWNVDADPIPRWRVDVLRR